MAGKLNPLPPRFAFIALSVLFAFSVACNGGPSQSRAAKTSTAKRYSLKGRVISVDKQAGTANIENEAIAGLMDPMVMSYTMKPGSAIDPLQPGDSVSADVVVQEDNSYWLENVTVIGTAKAPDKPSASTEKNRRSQ